MSAWVVITAKLELSPFLPSKQILSRIDLFAHRDRYNLKGDRDKEEIPLSYTDSLDLADKDINGNWDIYQERFLRGDLP
jgi:hypothetical protein